MSTGYKIVYHVLWPIVRLLYPCRYHGRENIVEGACIICANHSTYVDPLIVAFGFSRQMIHFMAKYELSTVPVLGFILKKCGVFFVKRGESDIGAVRAALRYLKNGERIMMFPEGTRVSSDDSVAAKSGAIHIAAKLGVPIIPVHIPRNKRLFHRMEIHIGQAYTVPKLSHGEYDACAQELMDRINSLGSAGR